MLEVPQQIQNATAAGMCLFPQSQTGDNLMEELFINANFLYNEHRSVSDEAAHDICFNYS